MRRTDRPTRPPGTTGWLNRLFMLAALAAFAVLALVGTSSRDATEGRGEGRVAAVGTTSTAGPGDIAPASPVLPASVGDATADALFGGRVTIVSFAPERFVELSDGTRLLPGARLAHGYRLAGIEREGLVLERGGIESTLTVP